MKAPRYDELPFEVGPLARLILNGTYENSVSAMDRSIARVLEARKITTIMKTLLGNLIPDIDVQKKYDLPEQ
ncbi:MAG TPA: Ni/Fe hydrogenase, partial [Paenibacillaceae bacterium]|nr:Ni/Fe hydrogenase [Paenibacillaceae bacterium]